MRKVFSGFFVFLLISRAAFGAEIAPEGTVARKAERGFLNIVLSPVEFANEFHEARAKDSIVPSWIPAAAKGGAFMTRRILAGTYELLTFPAPSEPILHPEFEWEHFKDDPAPKSKTGK